MSMCVLEMYLVISPRAQTVPVSLFSSQKDDATVKSITSEKGRPGWTQPPAGAINILINLETAHVFKSFAGIRTENAAGATLIWYS